MCPGHPQVLNFIFLSFSRQKPECSVSCVVELALLGAGEAGGLRPVRYRGFHTSLVARPVCAGGATGPLSTF